MLLAVYGSPRREGNTDTLLNTFLAEVPDTITVNRIILRDMDLQPCISCGRCEETGRCVFRDEIWGVYEALEQARALVIASPIYFASVTAQVKAFVDRAQPFWVRKYLWHEENMPLTDRAFFISAGAIHTDRYFKNARLVIRTLLQNLDIPYTGDFFLPGVDRPGDVLERDDALEAIGRAGASFIAT